jgi:hypothetical protein
MLAQVVPAKAFKVHLCGLSVPPNVRINGAANPINVRLKSVPHPQNLRLEGCEAIRNSSPEVLHFSQDLTFQTA